MEPVYELSNYLCQSKEINAWLETLRGVSESDKMWMHRREFIQRNVHAFCGNLSPLPSVNSKHPGLARLLTYSMVWTSHVFSACQYPNSVTEKALKLAKSIKVPDAPVHETREKLDSQMKRGSSSRNDSVVEPCKKTKANKATSSINNAKTATQKTKAKTGKIPSKRAGKPVKGPHRLTAEDTTERQNFFNSLYKTVAWKLVVWKLVAAGGFNLNNEDLLSSCIESLNSTLDITFVPLKELADMPQTKATRENIVCELRCKSVYLGMGCGKSKEHAKAEACREVIKLFQKKKVVVRICKRKYNGCEVEDLVLLDDGTRPVNLPPALKNPQELI